MAGLLLLGVLVRRGRSGHHECACDSAEVVGALGAVVARRYRVPSSKELSRQLVLIKIPETGSSTAALLLSEIAAKRGIPCWQHGGDLSFSAAIEKRPRSAPKWALAHRGWGPWVEEHFDRKARQVVTTTRAPLRRLYSRAEKRLLRGEPVECDKGTEVALRFWASDRDARKGLGLAKIAESVVRKFEDVWVMERYNESLVAFALTHRLSLGAVLPPLAKYHGAREGSAAGHRGGNGTTHDTAGGVKKNSYYAKAKTTCDRDKVEETRAFVLEAKVHEAAVSALDARLAKLEAAGVPVAQLVALFARHLHVAMTLGATNRDNSAHYGDARQSTTTLLMSDCARGCAAASLDANAVLDYD